MIAAKRSVLDLALGMALSTEDAEMLALEAASDLSWATKKFIKFILDFSTADIWTPDDLFHPPEFSLPSMDEFESSLRLVYEARSGASHGGRSFPSGAVMGIGPTIPSKALIGLDPSRPAFPPVVWFERVVNSALNGFIARAANRDDA
jgi:hypothetical protein